MLQAAIVCGFLFFAPTALMGMGMGWFKERFNLRVNFLHSIIVCTFSVFIYYQFPIEIDAPGSE